MFLKYAAVGVLAGFLSGLFGVGGGILIVPGLLLVAKMEQKNAHGTSLGATLPISAASLLTYWNHGNVNWAVALPLAIGAILGAIYAGIKNLDALSLMLALFPTVVLVKEFFYKS